jgi:hypothetical protein
VKLHWGLVYTAAVLTGIGGGSMLTEFGPFARKAAAPTPIALRLAELRRHSAPARPAPRAHRPAVTPARVTREPVILARVTPARPPRMQLADPRTGLTRPPAASGSGVVDITPQKLRHIIGPLVARPNEQSTVMAMYDARFQEYEAAHWRTYQAQAAANKLEYSVGANHYGALRSRLSWAIRNGEPIGPAATSTSQHAYARGRAILRTYLQWSRAVNYGAPPHNNTGLPDVEALYWLEGDVDARNHIHQFAAGSAYDFARPNQGTGPDNWPSYVKLGNSSTEIRWIYEALQAFGAAHRIGIPYSPGPGKSDAFDPTISSWIAAGERQIDHVAANIPVDGSLPMPGEDGCNNCENLLFNLELAAELLKWDSYVRPNRKAVALSRKIMAHILDVWESLGRQPLPYQHLASASSQPAPDLAGYVPWIAYATCQETGDKRYCAMADLHVAATRDAYIQREKQFNQTYSMGAQSTEAFRAGVRAR